jgi:hypothetical protein
VICPVLDDGHLYAGLIAKTPKCRDLLRDGRYVLHAPLGQGDAEFWIKGTAQPLSVDDTEKLMSKHEAWRMDIPSSMFELDIESAYGTLFQPGANGIPVPDRRKFSMA